MSHDDAICKNVGHDWVLNTLGALIGKLHMGLCKFAIAITRPQRCMYRVSRVQHLH